MKPIDPRLVRSARSTLPFLVTSVGLGTVTAVLTVGQAWVIAMAISRVTDLMELYRKFVPEGTDGRAR